MTLTIRAIQPADYGAVCDIFLSIVSRGDTYVYDPNSTSQDAQHHWIEVPQATYVATYAAENGSPEQPSPILGTYYIKPNQPGLGNHVCNCGYMVAENARAQGVATALAQHSQAEALRLGFSAIQFNCVVATNAIAIALWNKQGFSRIGTLPQAFRHSQLGLVDAYIMYKQLKS